MGKRPDLSAATRVGKPTLVDPKETDAPKLAHEIDSIVKSETEAKSGTRKGYGGGGERKRYRGGESAGAALAGSGGQCQRRSGAGALPAQRGGIEFDGRNGFELVLGPERRKTMPRMLPAATRPRRSTISRFRFPSSQGSEERIGPSDGYHRTGFVSVLSVRRKLRSI